MKKLSIAIGAIAFVAVGLAPFGSPVQASPVPASSMSIQVLPKTGPRTFSKPSVVTFDLKVSGMQLDSIHMGKKNIKGHGHIQLYVNRIPSDAYKTKDLKHNWLASLALPKFTLKLSPAILGGKGKHTIIVALAQNNFVLYHVKTATFTVTVK